MAEQNGSTTLKETVNPSAAVELAAESKGKGKAVAEPDTGMDVDDSSSEEEVDDVSHLEDALGPSETNVPAERASW